MPWRDRHPDLSRVIFISLFYAVALAVIAGVVALFVPRIVRETTDFIREFPQLFRSARTTLEQWNQIYAERIPVGIRQDIEGAFAGAGDALINAA